MNNQCNVVRDLLPLYCDNICSEESKLLIEEHLSSCKECDVIRNKMQSKDSELISPLQQDIEKTDLLKRINKRIKHRKILIAIGTIISTLAIVAGLYSAAILIEKPIAYKEGLLEVSLPSSDSAIDVFYQGSNYAKAYGMEKVITVNGEKQNVAYIYYTESFWSKHIEKKQIPGTYQFTIDNGVMISNSTQVSELKANDPITAIYYLIGDYSQLISLSEKDFQKYAENSILIWER
ncbi:MAG: hypothetical protein K0R00_4114 [Herbinix sp.]|nr:hypothetical protein [Herbinix sp.]